VSGEIQIDLGGFGWVAVGLEGDPASVMGPRGCLAVAALVSKPSSSDGLDVRGRWSGRAVSAEWWLVF